MTDNWQQAIRSVSAALEARRIGVPVFARVVTHARGDPGQTMGLLAAALDACSRWLGSPPAGVTALGDPAAGYVSVLVEFSRGQTALVSAGAGGVLPPVQEAVVIGTRGIVSWEPAGACPKAAGPSADSPQETARSILDAVHLSLRSGSPVGWEGGRPRARESSDEDFHQVSTPALPAGQRLKATPPPYGVLLISGAHSHQENYAEALAADPRCRLVGLTDEPDVPRRRQRLNEALARQLGIPLLADLDQALRRSDVQVASVVADPQRRARVIRRCAAAGKHLYLDKPMAATGQQADEAVRAIQQAGVVSQMFSQVRSSLAERLRQLVGSESLGPVRAIHWDLTFAKGPAGTISVDRPRRESARPERFEMTESKRELFNVGVYPLVAFEWLLGRRVRRVRAVTANYFFTEHRRNDMEDFAAVLLECEGGLIAGLAVGRTGWRSHPMGGLNRACLVGDRGAVTVDAYRPRLEIWADEMPWLPPRSDPEDPMGFWKSTFDKMEAGPKKAWGTPAYDGPSDATYFLDCVQRGRPSDVSAEIGASAVHTLAAAYHSAATGRFAILQR